MDGQGKLQERSPSPANNLPKLNYYCLLHIYKFLELDDCINLADAHNNFRYVADFLFKYKKFANFTIDRETINKGEAFIGRTLSHLGQHIVSLQVNFDGTTAGSNVLRIISKYCVTVKCLQIQGWRQNSGEISLASSNFHNLEMLTIKDCNNISFVKNYFNSVRKLKFLNVCECHNVSSHDLYTLFQNNPNIQSFLYSASAYSKPFDFQLINLVPKLERLRITIGGQQNLLDLNPILKLEQLTKLSLTYTGNCNTFLGALTKKGLLEELHLCAKLNATTFNILNSFKKLRILVLQSMNNAQLTTSPGPLNVKNLKLLGFDISFNSFTSIIEHMKNLEKIDLYDCEILCNGNTDFNNAAKLCQDICKTMDSADNQQWLEVILPSRSSVYTSSYKKYATESDRLRIVNKTYDGFNRFGSTFTFAPTS